jgi:D-arabinose 1-dehydrogenase-like Zn-dependent alcohol dehydrogenase
MLDFCEKHNNKIDTQLFNMQNINTAYERVIKMMLITDLYLT